MKRILLALLLVSTLTFGCPRGMAQTQTLKLSPGFYAGKFIYSSYDIMLDKQTYDGQSIITNSVSNVDIEGTLIFQVNKLGNISPGAQILVTLAPAYGLHTLTMTSLNCSVTSYISAESKGKITPVTSGTSSGVIKATLDLGSASAMYFKTMGVSEDCQPLADQEFMLEGVNNHIEVFNKLKTMQFVVVRASESSMSGSITIPGMAKKLSTPGGYISETEKGYFQVFKTDQLSSLEGVDPLGGVNLAPSGEWRDK